MPTNDTIGLTDKTFSNRKETTLKENLKRSLYFLPLNLKTIKLFVFVDRLFTNNANLTFNNHTTTGNIIYFSSTKYKRVTWSILTSEIYAIVASVDIVYWLTILLIPTVIYTNLYSLYECLIKLSTTKEKRLIIDIIALRYDNPANSFTKSSLNSALEALVSDRKVKIQMNRWVSLAGVFTLFDGAFYHKRKLPVLRYQSPGDIGRYADVSAAEARMFRR
ncbi:hypothetical protein LX36DRAFT_685044 [Colletotrichum falcatum]|nr:hypothetical protein LX36DRAFT_685044 [Colletotrichum falcatum]